MAGLRGRLNQDAAARGWPPRGPNSWNRVSPESGKTVLNQLQYGGAAALHSSVSTCTSKARSTQNKISFSSSRSTGSSSWLNQSPFRLCWRRYVAVAQVPAVRQVGPIVRRHLYRPSLSTGTERAMRLLLEGSEQVVITTCRPMGPPIGQGFRGGDK